MSDNNEFKVPGPPAIADLLDVGIEESILKEEEERQKGKVERFPLSPSQFGACGRLLAIGLAEYIGQAIYPMQLLDSRSVRRFSRGYDIEYSMLRQLKKFVPIKQSFEQQYLDMDRTPDGKYVIGGSLDTLFLSQEHMIVDIKSKATYYSSTHSDTFDETFKSIAQMPGVKQFGENAYFIEDIETFYEQFNKDDFISRYFLQLNAYGACDWAANFKSNLFPDVVGIKAVALLFENKNNHMMAELRWVPSRKLYDFAIQRVKDIYQYVAIDKKDPTKYKADFTLGSLACRLCPRRTICWGDARHPYTGPKTKWAKDSNRLPNESSLEKAYEEYKKALTTQISLDKLETELAKEMQASGESKIRFSDGKVFEVKALKSPKPHLAVRPSK